MRNSKIIFIFLIVFLCLTLINCIILLYEISELRKEVTGFASGYVNLTLMTSINIDVSRDLISWGSGTINAGQENATLYTNGDNAGLVLRGNWSGENARGIVVENTGNINCSISLKSNKNAHDFFGSVNNSNEQYMWNVSNKESGSCSGDIGLGVFYNVNKSSGGTKYCNKLNFKRENNEMYVDILLTVPYDGSNIGEQSDIITITGDVF